jgi:SAM-dependent methyltransferase
MIKENIYGHANRLDWIKSHLHKSDTILEFGCGTGYMITFPLARMGYLVSGIDSDKKSLSYGRELLARQGLDPDTLKLLDLTEINVMQDIIIASEVLEHITDDALDNVLTIISAKLKPGGKLLVTVPNGYGWFELESFAWNKLFIGQCLERSKIVAVIDRLKRLLFGKDIEPPHPSTLSSSPHVQRFTLRSIQNKLKEHGFDILDVKGSVLFCGQFSNLLFTGIKPIMKLNIWLGSKMTRFASAFYIAAVKK